MLLAFKDSKHSALQKAGTSVLAFIVSPAPAQYRHLASAQSVAIKYVGVMMETEKENRQCQYNGMNGIKEAMTGL